MKKIHCYNNSQFLHYSLEPECIPSTVSLQYKFLYLVLLWKYDVEEFSFIQSKALILNGICSYDNINGKYVYKFLISSELIA